MIRLRGSYLLLLAVGLLGTVITFAGLVPNVAHLAGPVTPIPAPQQHTCMAGMVHITAG